MTLSRFRNSMLLWVVGLYLLLNYGFMQVRFPPVAGGGIPIGELVLIFSLLTINYARSIPRLGATVFLVPFFIWWAFGLSRAFLSVPEYGMWALRDATHVIESLFLLVGFSFAVRAEALARFFDWLPKILIAACIYALGYPFFEILQSWSPMLVGGAGQDVPLLFLYINTAQILLWAVAYIMLFKHGRGINNKAIFLVAAFLFGYALFLFQARTIYLQVIALFILFLFYRRKLFGKSIAGVILLFCLLLAMPFIGLQIEGRLGQAVSVEFFINHFLAIGGIESEGLIASAGGVSQRLGWWLNLYDRWTSSASTFLFGLGYGFPLIDFGVAHGVAVREPHNSYISILARIGLLGGIVWIWMHILMLRVWQSAYKMCRQMRWRDGENRLLILMAFFIITWVYAIGEDAFEKSFIAIPYYFFWGIVLRFASHLKNGLIGPDIRDHDNPASQ